MARLRPVPAARHASPATFVHKDLRDRTRLSPPGRCTPGSGAPLQRPVPGPLAERENVAAPCARQANHCVCRLGQTSVRVGRFRPRKPYFELSGTQDTTSDTSGRAATTYNSDDYTLRSPRSLPNTLQHLEISAGGCCGVPTRKLVFISTCSNTDGPFKGRDISDLPVQATGPGKGSFTLEKNSTRADRAL
jgi:hypothetical protein